jgi:hypothetical protein
LYAGWPNIFPPLPSREMFSDALSVMATSQFLLIAIQEKLNDKAVE